MTENSRTCRGIDATGRSTKTFRDPRFRKQNHPPAGQPFVWLTKEILESFAWRAASQNARLLIDRVCVEHMAHAGTRNGALPVTYDNFEHFGIRRGSIASAIAEVDAIGLVKVAKIGERGWGGFRGRATLFRLAWLPTATGESPCSKWRRFESLEEARRVGEAAKRSINERHAPRKPKEMPPIKRVVVVR